MKKYLVSVIIPTYKTNDSITRAIDSVLNQSYDNIEIIVVDDNNPDSKYRKTAEELMKKYENKKNIKYIKHKANKNGSAARNTGVMESKGEYVCFLDDDDYYLPSKIEKQLNYLIDNKLKFCTCFYYRNSLLRDFKVKDNYYDEIFYMKTTPQTSSFFMKKNIFEELSGFDETYFRHQDYEFLLRVCQKCKIGVVEEPLYVLDTNGVINVPNGKKMEEIKDKFLKDFDYLITKENLDKKKIYARNYSAVCFAYLKSKDFKNAFRILSKYFSACFITYFFDRCLTSIRYKVKGK